MKKLLFLFLLAFPLIGCVPSVIIAGAAGAALGRDIVCDQRSYKTISQDHNARIIIQTKLNNNSKLKGQSHVSVSVFNNNALLVGQVKNAALRDYAYRIAITTPYIRHTYNAITVGTPISLMKRANDSWITTKVRTAIFRKVNLRFCSFKVVTENKIVYLMGILNSKQASIAAEIAERVLGVEKVVKVFEEYE